MSKKQKRVYVVRGFNLEMESFSAPTGLIEDKGSFKEVTVDSQAVAVATLLTDSTFRTLSIPAVINNDDVNSVGYSMAAEEPKNVISVLDVEIILRTDNKSEVRGLKSDLREVLKRWAEKSRVKTRRGFRANAIYTPVFKYEGGETLVRTQVILSNAVVYSDTTVDVSAHTAAHAQADVALLSKELDKRLNGYFSNLVVTDSRLTT
jgi:hypothetical protein